MEQKQDQLQPDKGAGTPPQTSPPGVGTAQGGELRLFIACFVALITTAFGFIVRAMVMNDWAAQFSLSETQKGEIFGVALWPFAISIVLFSLVIDRFGYGRAIAVAFVCHLTGAIITICAPLVLTSGGPRAGYWMLYAGNFIAALGNGTVEAVINPVVATMFSRAKTKWLNILHAGWPGGLVLGGVLTIGLSAVGPYGLDAALAAQGIASWQLKVGLVFIPLALYGILMLGCRFPVSERVSAGVSYRDMLKEAGVLSALVVISLIVFEVSNDLEKLNLIFQGDTWTVPLFTVGPVGLDLRLLAKIGVIALLTLGFGLYVRSLGRPMFFFLVMIMIPLATTELGTDTWITTLMESEMKAMSLNPGWVLVYTSFIMMVLRFFAGPIVHRISPLGLLAISATIAAVGLVSLSLSTGLLILAAATLYGFGKTFFWPTMLGVVAEQFPKGGALTLNMIAGIGMLGVGIVGAAFLGNIQDKEIDRQLRDERSGGLYEKVRGEEKISVFGPYRPLDEKKVEASSEGDKAVIKGVQASAQKSALFTVAIFPLIMLVCYLILILYFWSKGGYQAQVLLEHKAEDGKFTGGLEGPADM